MSETPSVSVVMPVVNEERHLPASVARVLDQDYPGHIGVVLAVGPSRDRTREVAEKIAEGDPRVHVVDNPSGRTPSGLNLAIAAVESDIVVRVDGHAMVPRDYIRTGVATLMRTGADNVGGIMAAHGETDTERAVALAMRSRFGVGDASFHVGGAEGPALTVYLGCFRRSAIERVGGYDESMVRAQDWELNLRIRETGGVVWFTPGMSVTYRPRSSLRALARQYHDYGRWRREVIRRHPDTVSLRYLAAPATVIAVGGGLVLAITGGVLGLPWLIALGLVPAVAYAVGNLVASVATGSRDWRAALRLPGVFATMHGAWGIGFLRGGVAG